MRRSVLLGQTISDWQGDVLGRVIDTWPFDGGGEPELAVVRMGRLGQRRMVPISELIVVAGELRLPFARYQVEDSPPYGEDRHTLDDDPHCAASYWRWGGAGGRPPARCPLRSGFSRPGRLFPP